MALILCLPLSLSLFLLLFASSYKPILYLSMYLLLLISIYVSFWPSPFELSQCRYLTVILRNYLLIRLLSLCTSLSVNVSLYISLCLSEDHCLYSYVSWPSIAYLSYLNCVSLCLCSILQCTQHTFVIPTLPLYLVGRRQCGQIGRFFGLWATFLRLCNN